MNPGHPAKAFRVGARHHRSLTAVVLLACLSLPQAARAGQPLEPPVGSAERKAILDVMRRTGDLPDRVFVVHTMRVQDGWAWVVVDPRSRDAANHYETESALLQRLAGAWRIVDRPCQEDGCDTHREMARIRSAHPGAPAAIFQP